MFIVTLTKVAGLLNVFATLNALFSTVESILVAVSACVDCGKSIQASILLSSSRLLLVFKTACVKDLITDQLVSMLVVNLLSFHFLFNFFHCLPCTPSDILLAGTFEMS